MSLSISYTGIRSGEYIVGSSKSKQCAGSLMQIRGFYAPDKQWVNKLDHLQLRDQFNNYGFFKEMSPEERLTYLNENATNISKLYLEDVPKLYVKIIKFTGTFITKTLSTEQINSLIAGNPDDPEGYWPIEYVYNMFPQNPRSKAKKHTLIFRPGNWCLGYDEEKIKTYSGLSIDADTGMLSGDDIKSNGYLFVLQGGESVKAYIPTIGINASKTSRQLSYEHLSTLAVQLNLNLEIMETIRDLISWFTPSLHKSLIQKLIRTRPSHVEYSGVEYPSNECLIVSFILLLTHPGSFVPNIQRYVTGMEAALKRLAVVIVEDSYIVNPTTITTLLVGAWIAQNEGKSGWTPSDQLILTWMEAAIEALYEYRTYKYDWHTSSDTITEWDTYSINYYLLSTLRAFKSDERMFCSVSDNKGVPKSTSFEPEVLTKRVMPLIHCVDHHAFTSIAHYLPTHFTTKYAGFKEIFQEVWNSLTSYNPRTKNTDILRQPPSQLISEINKAQSHVWISQMYTPQPLSFVEMFEFEYELDQSWLSAMIGPIEFKLYGVTIIIVVNPDDLSQFTPVRRPPRGSEETPQLTEEEKTQAIAFVKEKLSKGMKLGDVPPTLPMFKNSTVFFINDKFYLSIPGRDEIEAWEDIVHLKMSLPIHNSKFDDPIFKALTQTGDGIEANSHKFEEFLQTMPLSALKRSVLYISSFNKEIQLYKISRDGSGTNYSVALEDIWVHHLLMNIAAYYPGALQVNKQKFKVKNGPLMWTISKVIKNLANQSVPNADFNWSQNLIPEKRMLWEHQTDAISRLKKSKTDGKKVRIIWIPPGLGKCLDPMTPVLKFDGTIVLAKDIKLGDTLVGDDNKPRYVTSTTSGEEMMYTVHQSQADSYKVNESHILTLMFEGQLVDINVLDYLALENKDAYKGVKNTKERVYSDITISKDGVGDYCGFTLTDNGRFLLGDRTITHNTAIITNYISDLIADKTMPEYCLYTCPPSASNAVIVEFKMRGIPIEHLDMRLSGGGSRGLKPNIVNLIYHDHLRKADLEQIRAVTPNLMFINDEFHKTLESGTIRTSLALELARLSSDVIAMTGTLVKDTNVEDLNMWLEQSVDFSVTTNNYWVAISTIISRKIETKVVVERNVIEVEMDEGTLKEYYSFVPEQLGGNAQRINFKAAAAISYDVITSKILEQIMFYLSHNIKCFVVARNLEHQKYLHDELVKLGVSQIGLIKKDSYLSISSSDPPGPQVVITTTRDSEGYNMSQYQVMITGVYFTNEATREQLEHRINRLDQRAEQIRIVIIHSGIVSYIHKNYEKARNLSMALKQFAKDVDIDQTIISN